MKLILKNTEFSFFFVVKLCINFYKFKEKNIRGLVLKNVIKFLEIII